MIKRNESLVFSVQKPILVVMAAGMGSRYGGLKQIDPVGGHGEAILDFSLFDAHEAGFETAVIIIKEAIRKDFMETVGKRQENCPMEIRYAYQEVDNLPEGYRVPEGRVKPWGTCHAVLCAAKEIGEAPFAVINADDYYGKSAFRVAYDFLCGTRDDSVYRYGMVGYELGKTVSDNGYVSRGVCVSDENGYLKNIQERTRIEKYPGGIHYTEDDGATWFDLSDTTLVSMNMFCFTPSFLKEVEKNFPPFLDSALPVNPMKCEYFLPGLVHNLVSGKKATVKILPTADRWYGVTYAADKPYVVAQLASMTEEGLYPTNGLWK